MQQDRLVFLKLGGSLITDKTKPMTALPEVIERIVREIAQALETDPDLKLVIGHGSGSFGHAVASKYETQTGVKGSKAWLGFAEVWAAARKLNEIFLEALLSAGLPVIAFPPSAGMTARNHKLLRWDTHPIELALSHDLIPLLQGDVIFDTAIGGTIFSTEMVFQHLARVITPRQILLAGLDQGVWLDPDQPTEILSLITPKDLADIHLSLTGAEAPDVTGGMLAKVRLMLELVQEYPSLKIQIFTGSEPGMILKALSGENIGTRISSA